MLSTSIFRKLPLIICTGYFKIIDILKNLDRVGRAGRAGRKGFVTNLYHSKDNQVIAELKNSNDTGQPLKIKASAFS